MPKPDFVTAQFLVSAVILIVVVHVILISVAYCIYLERKISAYIQDRIGPNRVGFSFGLPFLPKFSFWGLGQPLADGIKFFLKEDYMPRGADRILFTLAPVAIVIPALIGFAIIPWGGVWNVPAFTIPLLNWHIQGGPVLFAGANISIGVVYLLAVASLGIYGVVLGGWSSNNKYSFLGSLRASSQMLSYEIPMGLSLLCVLLATGTLMPDRIIAHQLTHGWNVISQPLVALIFFLCVLAECNRAPFDNAECEQELVGGYHTEYSSMRFALFFLAEYSHMITSSAMFAVLFLGGWSALPFIDFPLAESTSFLAAMLKFGVLFTKVILLVCFMMVIRWSLPRLRFDQVMQIAWQAVIPLSMALIVAIATVVYLGRTSLLELLLTNAAVAAAFVVILSTLKVGSMNQRVRLSGSRFFPPLDESPDARPAHAIARDDHPITATAPVAS